MWEMFMECEYPLYQRHNSHRWRRCSWRSAFTARLTLSLDDHRSTGGERFGRELAAFLVDPMKGIPTELSPVRHGENAPHPDAGSGYLNQCGAVTGRQVPVSY